MNQLLILTLRKRVTLLHTDGSFTPEIYYATANAIAIQVEWGEKKSQSKNWRNDKCE